MAINYQVKEELKKYLKEQLEKERKIAFVISPYSFNAEELDLIKKSFSFLKNYIIVNKIDKTILGGFIIKFGTRVIDLTINNQLKSVKKIIYETY